MKATTYTRRQIIQKASLHDKVFMTTEDVEEVLINLANIAVGCGADEGKLMEYFDGDNDNEY